MTPPSLDRLGRRAFLAAMAATASACRTSAAPVPPETETATSASPPSSASAPSTATAPASDALDEATLRAAERLAAVEYTTQEREMMLSTLEDHIERAMRLRAVRHPNALAPATIFDPRLPGVAVGPPRDVFEPERRETKHALPSKDEDMAFAPITDLSSWIRRRKITSRALTDLYLSRLETHDPLLHCVVTATPELAREQASRADEAIAKGRARGLLHGIPWGAKDLIDTAGIATTWGATPYQERVAQRDAAVVDRLERAGAVLVAKLTTGALAYGDQWFRGFTRNPWNPEEGSSGSSAGPASAVAAGLVGFALGTETLGSIVSPSMRCGTAGLRPTFGRVPRSGCMALCWSLDKVGPIARTVEDTVWVLDAIRGSDPGDPSSLSMPMAFDARKDIEGMRVGWDPKWFEGDAANDIDRSALETVRGLGVEMVEVELPSLPWDALLTILFVEAATAFEQLTLTNQDDELAWQSPGAWPNTFRAARFITAIDFLSAQRLRRRAMQLFSEMFADVDAIFGPSYASSMLLATNCTGHPSLTVRAGFTERPALPFLDGHKSSDTAPRRVPHGVTFWGRLFDEGRLARLGMAFEAARGVWNERPPGFG